MAHDHHHHHHAHANERSLRLALWLTAGYLVVEVVGGLVSHSLALISDAAHMFTDTAALAIALAAIRVGKRTADTQRTFGYHRFEIIAAAFNALLLLAVAVYIVIEAYLRLRQPPEIRSGLMLSIAVVGLVVNLVGMRLLSSGKETSLNVKGAYLEVWSDALASIGVIAGALIIRGTGWFWVDTAMAIGIGLWMVPRTWGLLRESLHILLEGVPVGVALAEVKDAISSVPGVTGVHDLHVWAISSGKVSLTVHVLSAVPDGQLIGLSDSIRSMLAKRFDIHHSTVQLERSPCEQGDDTHVYAHPPVHEDDAHDEAAHVHGHADQHHHH